MLKNTRNAPQPSTNRSDSLSEESEAVRSWSLAEGLGVMQWRKWMATNVETHEKTFVFKCAGHDGVESMVYQSCVGG